MSLSLQVPRWNEPGTWSYLQEAAQYRKCATSNSTHARFAAAEPNPAIWLLGD